MNKTEVEILIEQGLSYSEVARCIGVSRQAVHEYCTRNFIIKKIKDKKISKRKQKKQKFPLGEELYPVASLKFSRKRENAKKRNIEFTITMEDIEWPVLCPVLDIELDYDSSGRSENSVSFDRINPNKGYIPGNVQIVSWRANRIKNDGTAEEHRKIAEYLEYYGH